VGSIVTLGAVLAFGIAIGLWIPRGNAPSSVESKNSPKPALVTTSAALWKLYDDFPAQADRDYRGKLVEITGQVINVNRITPGEPYVLLDPPPPPPRGLESLEARWNRLAVASVQGEKGVRCFFTKFPVHAREGETATVRGTCNGRTGNVVVLRSCETSH
jgi:hypothetical protein